MTNEEALQRLEKIYSYMDPNLHAGSGNMEDIETVRLAIEALEKQVPKKYKENKFGYYVCPCCGKRIRNDYCGDCGQKIKWWKEKRDNE